MKEIVLNFDEIRNFDNNLLNEFVNYPGNTQRSIFPGEAGIEPYKLYSYLSTKINNSIILDIGTQFGLSAVALSYNENNKVVSYDIMEWESHRGLKKSNINLKIKNFIEDEDIDYDNVSIILIDVDPHDGLQEPPMVEYLKKIGWSGILLFDDIDYNNYPMLRKMWQDLDLEKYNLNAVGHFSGTGMAVLGNKYSVRIVK